MSKDFEERHGWAPDSDYEVIKQNQPEKPFSVKAFMEFFEGQGFKFVDADTREPLIDSKLSLCDGCNCMTKTFTRDNTCMKCGAKKGE